MKESRFIKNNINKWRTLEKTLTAKQFLKDPEKASQDFLDINDDYSFSKTFYPSRSVKGILNNLAGFINLKFQGKPFIRKGLKHYIRTSLPYKLYEGRRPMQLALALFILFMVIGALSAEKEAGLDFVRQILGDNYVDSTLENIEKGDPMYVYKDSDPFSMQIYITFNNLYVALLSFVLGITGGLGSLFIMLKNGVMVGAFQYFFIKEGLFWESFLAIWMHGSTEIPAIILSGGAGFVLARGMFFPGQLSRIKSFQKSAKEATSIFIGVIPLIIFAGFVESFFTRLTGLPDILRFIFILTCLSSSIFYFYIYPYKRKKAGAFENENESFKGRTQSFLIKFYQTKNGANLFADSIGLYTKDWGKYVGLTALSAMTISAGYFITVFENNIQQDELEVPDTFNLFLDKTMQVFSQIKEFFILDQSHLGPLIFLLGVSICLFTAFVNITEAEKLSSNNIKGVFVVQQKRQRDIASICMLFISTGIFFLSFSLIPNIIFQLILLLPILVCMNFALYRTGQFSRISLGLKAFLSSFIALLGCSLLVFLLISIGVVALGLISDILVYFVRENFAPNSVVAQHLGPVITNFSLHFLLLNFIILIGLSSIQLIYVYKEKIEAISMLKKLDNFGKQQNIKGLIRE